MKLLNKEEKAKFIESLNSVKNGKAGTGQFTADGWRKFFNKKYDYIKLNDGSIIEVERPHIDKVVYYDDEQENPLNDNKKRNWMLYNLKNFDDFGIERWLELKKDLEETGCCSGVYIEKPYYELYSDYNGFNKAVPKFLDFNRCWVTTDKTAPIDEKELNELIKVIAELKSNYIKRLETYYKKYGEKIYGYGYWANR